MDSKKIYSQKEFDMWKESYMKQIEKHIAPSPKTLKLFEEIKGDNKKQWGCIKETNMALFGDGKKKQGIVNMVEEMHKVFFSSKFTYRFIKGSFIFLATLSAGIFGLIKLVKSMAG